MSLAPFDGPLGAGLFSDPDVAALFSDTAEVAAMVRVEAALARAQARIGVIPPDAGIALADALDALAASGVPAPDTLRDGAATSGVAVPALVAAVRQALEPALAEHIHWGATSQDIADTALVIRLKPALARIDDRLAAAIRRLCALADAHRMTPAMGRTWGQHAAPTSFGLIAASWADPLVRLRARAREMAPRLLAVQFGGAVGSLSALGAAGVATRDALAETLGLAPAPPWHSQRDRIGELAGWCADLTGAAGKIGQDLSDLAASERREIRLGAAGSSSTMPQKQNPVAPQTLVALARAAIGHVATLHGAALHAGQRDGGAWLSEWLSLPPLLTGAAGAARILADTVDGVEPDPTALRAMLDRADGAPLAEAASFALAAHIPRADAQTLVKRAAAAPEPLLGAISALSDAPVDWTALGQWESHLGAVDALIDQILAAASEEDAASRA